MTDRKPTETTNLDGYGFPALPWSRPHDLLTSVPAESHLTYFLSTTRPDGRPHAAGVAAGWHEGYLYFTSGPGTRKSRNLAANPSCVLSVSLTGLDLVLEGEATRVDDAAVLEALVGRFREGGWPAEVKDGAIVAPFSAPSAGPPPWYLYRFTHRVILGVATEEPYGATRWRFD